MIELRSAKRRNRQLLFWLIGVLAIIAVSVGIANLGAQQAPVDQEPDVPKELGKCAVYWTHEHGNGGRSYQLTCSAPIPDSVMVRLPRGE